MYCYQAQDKLASLMPFLLLVLLRPNVARTTSVLHKQHGGDGGGAQRLPHPQLDHLQFYTCACPTLEKSSYMYDPFEFAMRIN